MIEKGINWFLLAQPQFNKNGQVKPSTYINFFTLTLN